MIRILFIDDDPQAQKTLSMVLQEDYTVVSALTAAEGLEVLEKTDPDVVLLDINLPDRSGLDVLDDILQRPAAPPVVMVDDFNIRYQIQLSGIPLLIPGDIIWALDYGEVYSYPNF